MQHWQERQLSSHRGMYRDGQPCDSDGIAQDVAAASVEDSEQGEIVCRCDTASNLFDTNKCDWCWRAIVKVVVPLVSDRKDKERMRPGYWLRSVLCFLKCLVTVGRVTGRTSGL